MREAVLAMAYGTPERLEDVEAYYTHIRRGSPPPKPLLDELVERYREVGGPTALNRITRQQAQSLEEELVSRGRELPVYVGFKHHPPFVSDVVGRMAEDGIERAVGLVLAPHYSLRSIAEYEEYAEAARPEGMEIDTVRSWHDEPAFVDFLVERLEEALGRVEAEPMVLFTAHSVPSAVLERGDPYPEQLRESAEAIASRAVVERWRLAYQSAGRTPEPWLEPDILDVIEDLAEEGEEAVVVQPVGFVSDHLEVLYDIDIEAREAAESRGMAFARTEMPNDHPDFVAALADVVERAL